MRKVILFIASSLDGYIAREDGTIDWLFTDGDYGYKQFYDSVDTLLLGRKTYDQVLEFTKSPFEKKRCFVFTRQSNITNDHNLQFVNDPIERVKQLIRSSGKDMWLVGGSEIISVLLNADLINEIILSVHPIILGSGIPLFRSIQKLSCLRFLNSKTFESGLVQLHYELRQK